MKRTIRFIPEVKGCYGPRFWVDRNDRELNEFFKLVCLWGGPVSAYTTCDKYELCYELPFGILENSLWQIAASRLDLCLAH